MTKSKNTHLLFCVMLYGFINKTQGNSLLTRILNESNKDENALSKHQFTNENTNDTVSVGLQRRTNCIQFGNRPVICIVQINDRSKRSAQPYDDTEEILDLDDSEEILDFSSKPNIKELRTDNIDAPIVDLTWLENDLMNFHGTTARPNFDGDNRFSEDYFDINDLMNRKLSTSYKNTLGLPKKPRRLKIIVQSSKRHPRHARPEPRYTRKLFVLGNDEVLRPSEADDESSEETSKESSNENVDESNKKRLKPKRYEVIEDTDEEEDTVIAEDSTGDSSNEEEILKIPKKISNKNKEKYMYAQSPTRHLSLNMISDGRRWRLPHFLPKRYHWSKDDIHNLPHLWYNGPQGLNPGIYRKPY